MLCDQGRYHVQPWVIPFVLDPDTKAPLPRKGVQIGRAGFYDLALKSHWGGVITGDEIELDWDTPCACGRTSVHIADNIQRYSEKRGGDDKITCAATAEVHDDALSFMSELWMTTAFRVPLFIRGELIERDWMQFGGRGGDVEFAAPDPRKYAQRLPLATPMALRDLYDVSFDEILRTLEELGRRLDPDSNRYIQESYEIGLRTSGLTPSILKQNYRALPYYFTREVTREIAEQRIGVNYLEGWVERTLNDGRKLRIRAFGSRAVHVVAGNSPVLSGVTVIRNAITRSDAIIKTPSNDPLTAVAIARTLRDVGSGPSFDQAPVRRLLEGWRRGGRERDLPAFEGREDRRLGRPCLGAARDALHPARPRADCARSQA